MADESENQQSLHDGENMPDTDDGVQQVVLNAQNLIHAAEMVDGTHVNVVEAGVTEDILQQALEEAAAGGFDVENATVEYRTENGEEHQFVTVSDGLTVSDLGDGNTYTIINNDNGEQILTPYTIGDDQVTQLVNSVTESASFGSQHIHEVVELPQQVSLPVQLEIPEDTIMDPAVTETEQAAGSLLNVDSGAPLGSSDNPIRIVQQGNQYTSVQQLTPEQLTHIMQVLQQQQVAKATQEAGSSTLFNPQTNTKIVYRVIYPSDLHKSAGDDIQVTPKTKSILGNRQVLSVGRGRGRGRPRKHPLPTEEDDKLELPELSREEKDARKKQRPRTRSGRVSKPPKHMVKDYKHIHLLDWEEDYDDDDGGYSDYKASDNDEDDADSLDTDSLLEVSRPRKNKCPTCGKGYIGRGGLARHFKLFPDHGTLAHHTATNTNSMSQEVDDFANGVAASPASSTSSAAIGSNIVEVKPVISLTEEPTPAPAQAPTPPPAPPKPTPPIKRGPGRPPKGGYSASKTANTPRGRPIILDGKPNKRKVSLKEFIKQCEDEELMEVVLPRLVNAITLWEFLMMKSEKGRPLKPCIPDIVHEFEALHKQVQKVCQEYLKPAGPSSGEQNAAGDDGTNRIELTNEAVAKSLGLGVGSYDVMDIPLDGDTPFQYKYLTTEDGDRVEKNTMHKRTIQVVNPEDLVGHRPNKRVRIETDDNTSQVFSLQDAPSSSSISDKKVNTQVSSQANSVLVRSPNKVPTPRIHIVSRATDRSAVSTKPSPSQTVAQPVASQSQPGVVLKPAETVVSVQQPSTSATGQAEVKPVTVPVSDSPDTQVVDSVPALTGGTTDSAMIIDIGDSEETDASVKLETESTAAVSEGQPLTVDTNAADGQPSAGTETHMNGEPAAEGEDQILVQMDEEQATDSNQVQIFQTSDGVILVQKPDGTLLQIQHPAGEPIPLETVQALLAMDGQGALEQGTEAEVVEQ